MTALVNRHRKLLLGLALLTVLGTAVASVLTVGRVRGMRAAKAARELTQWEMELVDKKVLAENLETSRAEYARLRGRGGDWPVRADASLLRRLRRALPGATVTIEDDSGDSAVVRVRVQGGWERRAEVVTALQKATVSIAAVRMAEGEVEVLGSLVDTIAALESARARRAPAPTRPQEDAAFAFDLFGAELERIEGRKREVRAELERIDALLGPAAFLASAKLELDERLTVLGAAERRVKQSLAAEQLRAGAAAARAGNPTE